MSQTEGQLIITKTSQKGGIQSRQAGCCGVNSGNIVIIRPYELGMI